MSSESPNPISEHLVDSEELAALIRAAIDDGHEISLNAPGGSMMPFIRSDDKIFISPLSNRGIRRGDVLMFVRAPDKRVIAHRVIKIESDRYLCKGDNVSEHTDGWIPLTDVLGRVDQVQRNGRRVRLGVETGNGVIAWLSKKNLLVPLAETLRKVKWGVIKLFSAEDKSKF
jgi:hypothetical protein